MTGTPRKSLMIAFLGLILLNPVTAQSSLDSCLNSEHKATISALADSAQNVSQSDIEDIFEDVCSRDQTYASVLNSDLNTHRDNMNTKLDNFENRTQSRIDTAKLENKEELKTWAEDFISQKLVSQNELAKQLEGLNATIEHAMADEENLQEINSRLDKIENTEYITRNESDALYVTEDRFEGRLESNSATGAATSSTSLLDFWSWWPFAKLYTFLGIVLLILGGYWAHQNDQLPDWVYEHIPNSGEEFTDEDIEAMRQGGLTSDEEKSGLEDEEDPEKTNYHKLKQERDAEEAEASGDLEERYKMVSARVDTLRSKGATRTKEEEQEYQELQEELEELEDWVDMDNGGD